MIACSPGFLGSKDAVRTGNYDVWQVFGFCDQNYIGLSVDWDTFNPPAQRWLGPNPAVEESRQI